MSEKALAAQVLDARGHPLSPCSEDKARRMLAEGSAVLISEDPLTIRLPYRVDLPVAAAEELPAGPRFEPGSRVLLHICCGPCSTYPINWLRDRGYDVKGLWYNPNIHPWQEHEKRRASAQDYAARIGLEIIHAEVYEMPRFLRLVAGHERVRERCRLCYQMRLERTAQAAVAGKFDAFTTTLLISPHQDQKAVKAIGEVIADRLGTAFLFENFRRGWEVRTRLAKEHSLYCQQYCGCLYSEWERYNGQPVDLLLDDVT